MDRQELENEALVIYETVREIFTEKTLQLENYITSFKEAGDLGGIDEDELEQILPEIVLQHTATTKITNKLNNVETQKWFVGMVTDQLEEKFTQEDFELMKKATVLQDKLTNIFETSSGALVEYLSQDIKEKVVLN